MTIEAMESVIATLNFPDQFQVINLHPTSKQATNINHDNQFTGPVREVHTRDAHHGHSSIDYVSKPDYQFEYGVEDPKSKVSQFRTENRLDDAVVGEYSYTDPFGHVRLVKYTADKLHGFRAEIYIDGKLETPHSSSHHEATVAEHETKAVHDAQEESPQYQEDSGDYTSNEDY